MGALFNRWSRGVPVDKVEKNSTGRPQEEVSFTKGIYVVFNIKTTGISNIWRYIIKNSATFFAPDETGVNIGNFHSLLRSPRKIPFIITKLTGILKGDVEYCQEYLVVEKKFFMFMKNY